MTGRVYAPILGRFLSADPPIPHPEDDKNYNRYTYVLNNPTGYTAPSGFAKLRVAEMVGGRSGAMGGLLGGLGQVISNIYMADEIITPTAQPTPTPTITAPPTSTLPSTLTPVPSNTPTP